MLIVSSKVSQDSQSLSKSAQESDEYLIQQCLRGDTQSYAKLYRRHQSRVRSILYQICGPSSLDDLVQEVFLRAWKHYQNFGKQPSFLHGCIV